MGRKILEAKLLARFYFEVLEKIFRRVFQESDPPDGSNMNSGAVQKLKTDENKPKII